MKAERAIEILEMLMEGVDPYTGEVLPQAFIFEQADVIMALCRAVQSLKREIAAQESSERRKQGITKNGALNASRTWTKDDDQRLTEMVKSKVPLEEMCIILHRRARGIQKRCSLLGLSLTRNPNDTRPARIGARWLPEEDKLLQEMFKDDQSLSVMADALQRSERGVAYRLQNLQLIDDAESYLAGIPQEKKYDKDDLKEHFLLGETIPELAQRYNITEQAVQARLFYMGLSQKAPNILPQRKKDG